MDLRVGIVDSLRRLMQESPLSPILRALPETQRLLPVASPADGCKDAFPDRDLGSRWTHHSSWRAVMRTRSSHAQPGAGRRGNAWRQPATGQGARVAGVAASCPWPHETRRVSIHSLPDGVMLARGPERRLVARDGRPTDCVRPQGAEQSIRTEGSDCRLSSASSSN